MKSFFFFINLDFFVFALNFSYFLGGFFCNIVIFIIFWGYFFGIVIIF